MESKYNSLSEWRKAENKAYTYARLNSLLPLLCEKFNWEHYYDGCKTYSYGKIGKVVKTFKLLLESNSIIKVEFIKGYYHIKTDSKYDFLENYDKSIDIWNSKNVIIFGFRTYFETRQHPRYPLLFKDKFVCYKLPFSVFNFNDSSKRLKIFNKINSFNSLLIDLLEEKYTIKY